MAESQGEVRLLVDYLDKAKRVTSGAAADEAEKAAVVAALLLHERWVDIPRLTAALGGFGKSASRPEAMLISYDLIEVLWGRGRLEGLVAEAVQRFLDKACRPRPRSPYAGTDLGVDPRELVWRMGVQSHCLRGFGRWQMEVSSRTRKECGLSADPSAEAMAEAWVTWFHASPGQIHKAAREALCHNPRGAKYRIGALEVMLLGNDVGYWGIESDCVSLRREWSESSTIDDVCQAVSRITTGMRSPGIEPRKELLFEFARYISTQRLEVLLGERMALRNWMIGSWKRVVGWNALGILQLAYTYSLEGANVVDAVIDAWIDLAWADPYTSESTKILEAVFPRVASSLDRNRVSAIVSQLTISPPQIANLAHPGLKLLRDAFPIESFAMLAEWTIKAIDSPGHAPWSGLFTIWAYLIEVPDWRDEIFVQLPQLLDESIRLLDTSWDFRVVVLHWLLYAPINDAVDAMGTIVN